jgi:hypothetical protein
MTLHRRKGEVAMQVQDNTWKLEEKSHAWDYKRAVEKLRSRTRERDDESLRRESRLRLKGGEICAAPSTGPREFRSVPREIQDTTYPRSRILYYG